MSRRDGACWRHPAQRAAGVCADCLKERLSALSPSAEALVPRRASYSDRSSAFGFVAPVDRRNLASGACNRLGSGDYGVARGGAAQRQQQLVSPLLAEAYLRRSKSWSHWEGSSGVTGGSWNNAAVRSNNLQMGNGFAGRKSDAVLDDWTRQRFFSIFAKDLSQQKRKESSACPSNNRSTPQHFHGAGNERGAYGLLASSKIDGRRESLNAGTSSAAGLENRSSSSAKKSSRKSSSSSAWWTSMLAAFRKSKPKASAEAETDRKKSSNTNSNSSLASYFNRARKEEARLMNSAKGREFSNWRQHPGPPPRPADSNQSWISSPLRIFKHGNSTKAKKSGNCSHLSDAQNQQQPHHQHHQQQQSHQQTSAERQSSSEDPSSWSIPSSTELKKLQAATPAYTAYYRDYGAWSLSSSPVPNNRWSNANNCGRGKQPWENRDVSHTASSPYHRFGSSTWNFYLTPLRPAARAKATATRY